MLDDRLKSFEDTLTDDKLKQHSRFISLQEQIALGKEGNFSWLFTVQCSTTLMFHVVINVII